MPDWQLDIKPLDAPGLGVAAQSTGGAFAVDAVVSQAYANEVNVGQSHFPVMASCRETLGGEHLGADSKASGAVGVVYVLVWHGGLSEVLGQRDAFMGGAWIESEFCGVWKG